MKVLAIGAGRDGTVSLTSMISEIYKSNGLTGDVIHEYEARSLYNNFTAFKDTGDQSYLAMIDALIDAAPAVAVGNGYQVVLDRFLTKHQNLKLIAIRRRDEAEHIKSLCKIATMWPQFMGGYTDQPAEMQRLCAYHLGEMSKDEWNALSTEDRFKWYRNSTYSAVSSYRDKVPYLEVETESLASNETKQKIADFVAFPGAVAPSSAHQNRRAFVSVDEFSSEGAKLALIWFRQFSHERFEKEPNYAVEHALHMFHNLMEREISGQASGFKFGLSNVQAISELRSLDAVLTTYKAWVTQTLENAIRQSRTP